MKPVKQTCSRSDVISTLGNIALQRDAAPACLHNGRSWLFMLGVCYASISALQLADRHRLFWPISTLSVRALYDRSAQKPAAAPKKSSTRSPRSTAASTSCWSRCQRTEHVAIGPAAARRRVRLREPAAGLTLLNAAGDGSALCMLPARRDATRLPRADRMSQIPTARRP